MTMTPEERKQYEEQSRENIRKAKEQENKHGGVIGCLVVIAVIFIVWILISNFGSINKQTETKSETFELQAGVVYKDGKIHVLNAYQFDWTDVKLEINSGFVRGGYVHRTKIIKAKSPYVVEAYRFTKSDGTRLNPYSVAIKNMSISCETPHGHSFWYDEFEE